MWTYLNFHLIKGNIIIIVLNKFRIITKQGISDEKEAALRSTKIKLEIVRFTQLTQDNKLLSNQALNRIIPDISKAYIIPSEVLIESAESIDDFECSSSEIDFIEIGAVNNLILNHSCKPQANDIKFICLANKA
jgi:hypothetical protein